jgi:hypothetical protein
MKIQRSFSCEDQRDDGDGEQRDEQPILRDEQAEQPLARQLQAPAAPNAGGIDRFFEIDRKQQVQLQECLGQQHARRNEQQEHPV